jgi:hypothetical protein
MKMLEATINDEFGLSRGNIRKDEVTVTADARGVYIKVKGYSAVGGDDIIMLENYMDRLRLHVWSDIDKEDATHTIDLEKSKLF